MSDNKSRKQNIHAGLMVLALVTLALLASRVQANSSLSSMVAEHSRTTGAALSTVTASATAELADSIAAAGRTSRDEETPTEATGDATRANCGKQVTEAG